MYAGCSAGSNSAIQLRSNDNESGIISTTSGGILSKVTVVWQGSTQNGRVLNIYGKHSAYSSTTELYNGNTQGELLGTITFGTSTELTVSGDYEYIGVRSDSGALYLTSITITYSGNDNAVNVANYIMLEDKEGQCTGSDDKLNKAITKLNTMSSDEKSTFWTSNDYVIKTARERLEAWARHEGKVLSFEDDTYIISPKVTIGGDLISVNTYSSYIVWIIAAITGLSIVGGYFLIKKKNRE